MDEFLNRKGKFTCGYKYICFSPEGEANYINFAQRPEDMDEALWESFSDSVVEYLNKNKESTL